MTRDQVCRADEARTRPVGGVFGPCVHRVGTFECVVHFETFATFNIAIKPGLHAFFQWFGPVRLIPRVNCPSTPGDVSFALFQLIAID